MYTPITFQAAADALLTQIKGIQQEMGKGSSGLFLRFHSNEVLVLFYDVPTSYHTRTTRLVISGDEGRYIADLKRLPLP